MKTLSDVLRAADPLSDDEATLAAARAHIERVVGAARPSSDRRSRPPAQVTRRLAVVVTVVTALAISAVAGSRVIPGWSSVAEAAIRFEVRLAEDSPRAGLVVAQDLDGDRLIYLHPESIVSNDDIAQAWISSDADGRYVVHVEFEPSGAQRMAQATGGHLGRPLAILIDGKVVMAPTLRSKIDRSAIITGDYTRSAAERLANGIQMP